MAFNRAIFFARDILIRFLLFMITSSELEMENLELNR